jgi:hypothetical protein
MVLNENLELMVKRYVDGWDSETIVSLARELLAARKVVEAANSVSIAIENGEDLSSEAHEAMDLLTQLQAYDAATKGE